MTTRALTIAGYLVLLAVALLLQLAAHDDRLGVPSLQSVLARAMRNRPGRIALIAGWAWLGLHFFAR